MANIIRRNNGGERGMQPTPMTEWEPFRLMRDLLRWDPFREMGPMLPPERHMGFVPDFDVKETKDGYLFKADLPGIKEKDLEITMTGNRLTVSGKREAEEQEKTDTYFAWERSYGSFARSFTLPEGIDAEHIAADLKEGVLTLVVPKKPEVQPKKISVKSAEKKS